MTDALLRSALLRDGWRADVRIDVAAAHRRGRARRVAPRAGDERHAVAIAGVPTCTATLFSAAWPG